MQRIVYLGPAALAFAAACSSTSAEHGTAQPAAAEQAEPDTGRSAASAQASVAAPRHHSPGNIMNRHIANRFPGAVVLDEPEFASAIVGRRFRYRLPSEIIIERPAESFFENDRYSVGHRVIYQGKYSFERGVVSIECASCGNTFLGLSRQRVFFRHQGKLLMANADGLGSVVELISELDNRRGTQADSPTLSPSGIEQLVGEQLGSAIRGRSIVARRAQIATPSSEQFREDGTYVRHGDRVQAHGRYEILTDRYCATVSAIRRCFSLYRDRDDQYYLRQVFPIASDYWPVQLVK